MIGSAWECSNKEELQEALSIFALAIKRKIYWLAILG
jgi:hypothetical protein